MFAGPTVGGWIVTNPDWRWIFFINPPISVVVLAGTLLIVPDVRARTRHRLDGRRRPAVRPGAACTHLRADPGPALRLGRDQRDHQHPSLLALGLAVMVAFAMRQSP
jgi:MFS family permease